MARADARRRSALAVPLGLYAEQPYTLRAGREPSARLARRRARDGVFEPLPVGPRDRAREVARDPLYRSQLPLLGMRRSLRGGAHRYALGREWVARLPD